MNLDQCVHLAGWMLAMGLACAACTFPSVDYDTSCAAPLACEKAAETCANKAQAAQNMCSMKCSGSCLDCDDVFALALASCVAQCESCSASDGCRDATESCKALLGVP